MKALVEMMIKELVDEPDKVDLKEVKGEGLVIFEVRCAKSDLGKIIGKQGKNVHALRTIIKAVATKHKIRAEFEIIED